jgi:flagellar basal-body rod modification protein FlgD
MQVASTNLISTDTNYQPGSTRTPTKTLNQDDFLKLVLAQLTNQDPLNPQKDTEFIAQMTQFSALEQSKSMQQDIAKLQTDQQFLQANSMLGRVVTLQDDQGNLINGTVTAIDVQAGTPQLVVNNQDYDLSAVLSITPAPNP